jgi:hypothetical protein
MTRPAQSPHVVQIGRGASDGMSGGGAGRNGDPAFDGLDFFALMSPRYHQGCSTRYTKIEWPIVATGGMFRNGR